MLIWGAQLPIAKGAYAAVDGITLTLVRYAGGFIAFPLLLAWREGWGALSTDRRGWTQACTAGTALGVSVLLLFIGLTMTRPEIAVIILALQPAMTALAHWELGRGRPAAFTLACIVVAFTGVVLVVSGGGMLSAEAVAAREGEWRGNLLAVGASCTWITYAMLTARITGWSTLRISAMTSIPAFAIVVAAWIVAWVIGAIRIETGLLPEAAWRLAYLAIFGVVLGMFLWNAALQRIGTVDAMLLSNLMPVTTFAIRAIEGARFETIELVGAAFVVVALVANSLWLKKQLAPPRVEATI